MTLPFNDRYTRYEPVVLTTEFQVDFNIFDVDDVVVIIDGVTTIDFTVTASFSDGFSSDAIVVLNSAVTGSVVEIVGQRLPRRTFDYRDGSPDLARNLQRDLDANAAVSQELYRRMALVEGGQAGTTVAFNVGQAMAMGDIAALNLLSEGSVEPWHFGAQSANTFFGNAEAYKEIPKLMGAGEARNVLQTGRFYSSVTDWRSDMTIGDRITYLNVAGVPLVRASSSGSIDHPDGSAWSVFRSGGHFENRAQVVSFIAAVTADGTSTFSNGDSLYWADIGVVFESGSTEIDDMPGFVPNGWGSPDHFGDNAVPGTTNMHEVLEDAAAHGVVQLRSQTYAATSEIDTPNDLVIKGDSLSSKIIRPPAVSSGNNKVFDVSGSARFEGFTVEVGVDTGASLVALMNHVRDDVVLKDMTIDMNVETAAGVRNYPGSAFFAISGVDVEGLTIDHCHLQDIAYTFLKPNTTVSTERRFKITYNKFEDYSNYPLLFNSPATGSLIEDIVVIGNTIGSNFQSPAAHRGSFAGHVNHGRVIGNYAHGDGDEFWRMEEGASYNVFLANTAYLNGEHGFESTANSVGGPALSPENNIISQQIYVADAAATGSGVEFNFNVQGPSFINGVVTHCILKDWDVGIRVAKQPDGIDISHNIIQGCTTGLRLVSPSLSIRENHLISVGTPFSVSQGGLVGRTHFANDDGTFPTINTMVTKEASGSFDFGLGDGWTWQADREDIGTGAQTVDIMPLGRMIEGKATVSFMQEGSPPANYGTCSGVLLWDGTTFRYTSELVSQTGTLVGSGSGAGVFTNDGTNLQLAFFNAASALSGNFRVQVKFDGTHLF